MQSIKDNEHIGDIKKRIIELAESLANIFAKSKGRLNSFAQSFLKSGDTVLVVGYSSLIEYILRDSVEKLKRIHVVVTESRPNCEG